MPPRNYSSDQDYSGDLIDLPFADYSGTGFRAPDPEQVSSGTGFRAPDPEQVSSGDEFRDSDLDHFSSGDGFPSRDSNRPFSGDGYAARRLQDVGRSESVQLTMARTHVIDLPLAPLVTKPTPSTESWKLAGLVVMFLIWVSTASTLLFLYMDRYLFG